MPITDFVPCRPLTPAELRLLPLMAEAEEYKIIAAELGLSCARVVQIVTAIAAALPGCGKPQLKVMRYAVMQYAEAEIAARTGAVVVHREAA